MFSLETGIENSLILEQATLSTDNILRTYESLDQQHWTLADSLDIAALQSSNPSTPHASNVALTTPTQAHVSLDGTSVSPIPATTPSTNQQNAGIKEADGQERTYTALCPRMALDIQYKAGVKDFEEDLKRLMGLLSLRTPVAGLFPGWWVIRLRVRAALSFLILD